MMTHYTVRQYLMTAEVKKVIVLFLQPFNNFSVLFRNFLDALNAKIFNTLRLVDQFHQLDDLFKTFCERVKLSKDIVLAVIDIRHFLASLQLVWERHT